jgi:hypothetical protein
VTLWETAVPNHQGAVRKLVELRLIAANRVSHQWVPCNAGWATLRGSSGSHVGEGAAHREWWNSVCGRLSSVGRGEGAMFTCAKDGDASECDCVSLRCGQRRLPSYTTRGLTGNPGRSGPKVTCARRNFFLPAATCATRPHLTLTLRAQSEAPGNSQCRPTRRS